VTRSSVSAEPTSSIARNEPQIGEHHWTPTLRFDDDQGLGGYEIRVRPFAYRDLRDIAFAKFGRPANEAAPSICPGERFNWRWPSGTLVVLYEHCGNRSTDDACLTARSGTYSQMLNARRSREIAKANKQF
jgi:hypothetical protein